MKNKILKAIKGLKSFTIEDLELITGCDESVILETLKQLPVKNSDNIFKYEKPVIKIPAPQKKKKRGGIENLKPPEIKRIKIPEFTEEELRIYSSAPESAKKKSDKYLRIIKLTGGINGKKLRNFISYWNKQYPELTTSYSSVMKARKKIQQEGLLSLLTIYTPHNKGKTSLREDMYSRFKDLYLNDSSPTATSCYQKVKQEFMR